VKKIDIKNIKVELGSDSIKFIYIPDQRQILEPGQEYEIVISRLQITPALGFKFEKKD
jgi:hypothetical protein